MSELVESAKASESELRDMHQDIHNALQNLIAFQNGLYEEEKSRQYLEDVFVLHPIDDMDRIERQKGGLLNNVFNWILDTPQYTSFIDLNDDESGAPSQLLWIKGHAGMGKTMLMISIIRQLSDQIVDLAPSVSYYFCQGTDEGAQNSAMAIIRSLIWMILVQQPDLMKNLKLEYERQHSNKIFSDSRNALETASRVFKRLLADADPVYFIVDALDECNENLDVLIELISTSVKFSKRVKWLFSSRPSTDVLARIEHYGVENLHAATNVLDLGTLDLRGPVNAYVEHKLPSPGKARLQQ